MNTLTIIMKTLIIITMPGNTLFDLLKYLMEVRNLIFNRSTVNVKKGYSFICFNLSKIFTFLTVRCGCSYCGGYIHGARRLAHWRIAHRRLAQRRIAHRRKAHRQRRFAHPHLHICQLHSYLSLSSLLCCTVAPNVRSS